MLDFSKIFMTLMAAEKRTFQKIVRIKSGTHLLDGAMSHFA